jgi:hypothetical protein
MRAIIVEGVLFVAMLAAGGALLYWILLMFTPAGVRIRQRLNRKRIERAVGVECPIHGRHAEEQLVRLVTGERMCPDCYKETLNG